MRLRTSSPARLAAALAAGAILATACGTAEDEASAPAVASDDGASADGGAADAPPADSGPVSEPGKDDEGSGEVSAQAVASLDFTAMDLAGGEFDGTDFAGQDVVLWVWAPWCSVCNREAPKLRGAFSEVQASGDVVLLGLPGKDSVEKHEGFVSEHDLGFLRHVVDADGSIWAKYGVSYQPAFIFINDDGQVRVHAGPMESSAFAEAVAELRAA